MMSLQERKEQGFVSIFAVLIIMTVLTLVTVGFSTITRSAEKRTLDNQLNTQAFYAAESGVNDAVRLLQTAAVGSEGARKTECQGATVDLRNMIYNFDQKLDVGYSCVLIDPTPGYYQIDSVPEAGAAEPYVTQFSPRDGSTPAVPSYLDFYWDSQDSAAALPSAPGYGLAGSSPFLPPRNPAALAESWGSKVGILRVDLVQNNGVANALSRGSLVDNSYAFLLYPTTDGVTAVASAPVDLGINSVHVQPGTANKAGTLVTTCGTGTVQASNGLGYRCRGRIYLDSNSATSYTLRLQSYYNSTRVVLTAFDGTGRRLNLADGPAIVDVTGRAKDVFRRIKELVNPNAISGSHASFALLSADSICKRLISAPGTTHVDTVDLPVGASTAACSPDSL